MIHAGFSPGGILRIVFRYINESPRTMAELYLYRDRTLVYKWLHDSAAPPKALVPGIVAFVMEKTCEPVRLSIRSELEAYVAVSGIAPGIAALLAGTSPFQKYMEDLLLLAISLPSREKSAMEPVVRLEVGTVAEAGQDGTRKGLSIPITELAIALLAVFFSSALWNGINRLLGWTCYMGGTGREPRGLAAAVWGISLALPIILLALAARRKAGDPTPRGGRPGTMAICAIYTLSCMVGALAFYNSGLRTDVEGLRLGYGFQELVIAFAFAILVSPLPFIAIMVIWSAPEPRPRLFAILGYSLFPPLLVLAGVSFTLLIDRPIIELEQLRGFLAGLMLRIGMYLVARRYCLREPRKRSVRSG